MIRRPPRSTLSSSSAASDVYKRQEEASGLHSLAKRMFRDATGVLEAASMMLPLWPIGHRWEWKPAPVSDGGGPPTLIRRKIKSRRKEGTMRHIWMRTPKGFVCQVCRARTVRAILPQKRITEACQGLPNRLAQAMDNPQGHLIIEFKHNHGNFSMCQRCGRRGTTVSYTHLTLPTKRIV